MAEGEVLVDGRLCHSFPSSTDNLPEKIDVTCSPPLAGQVVKFRRHGVRGNWDSYLINICEVQVWGKYSRTSSGYQHIDLPNPSLSLCEVHVQMWN